MSVLSAVHGQWGVSQGFLDPGNKSQLSNGNLGGMSCMQEIVEKFCSEFTCLKKEQIVFLIEAYVQLCLILQTFLLAAF